ncbi:MAG: hypothetical protein HOG95_04355 [Rhodospirillaceae bacterium]|jgi:hypothetical protein|nr:hypothetical protein [Rhodospirillaceae bacterium]MBT4587711.1 hypothetical protein [Rhodospirillaceae bacterium]MBT5939138.1 hypothetical protein [Rhodospirillaceae bacterium]MBT7268859.1 hypothetical protein [Rhodospirillaceae bacterium]
MQVTPEIEQGLEPKRGVIPRLLGAALLFVGALDAMLSWRAGNAIENFYIFLMAAGLIFVVIGLIRGRPE